MFISCCNSTFKIYGHDMQVDEEEIGEFLNNYFSNDSQIDIEILDSFTKKIKEIYDFCLLVDKKPPK